MKVLIIEDEKLAADRLVHLLTEYDPSIEVKSRLDSVKGAVAWLEENPQPDLVLMDIQLADGLSFEIFEKLDISIPVIFTTAFNEYALRAFKVNSIDYLLKPIGAKELKSALDKFRNLNFVFTSVNKESIKDLKEMMSQQYKNRFIVKMGIHLQSVLTEDIFYIFSREKITFIQTKDNKRYPVDYTLEQIESLVSPKSFFRINRKFIININAVKDIITYSNSRLKIVIKDFPEEETIVSREKVQAFKSWLDN